MQNRRDTDVQNRLLDSVGEGEGCSERTALKQVYYQGWNRSPAQAGCMRQGWGLVHWEDPEGWDGEGGGRGDQDGEHM